VLHGITSGHGRAMGDSFAPGPPSSRQPSPICGMEVFFRHVSLGLNTHVSDNEAFENLPPLSQLTFLQPLKTTIKNQSQPLVL